MIDGQKIECNMEIKRDIMSALLKWKQRSERKPLLIQGACQIGKTWIMRKFGEDRRIEKESCPLKRRYVIKTLLERRTFLKISLF